MAFQLSLLVLLPLLAMAQNSDIKSKVIMFEFDEVAHFKYVDNDLPSLQAKTQFFKGSKTNTLRQLLYKDLPKNIADSTSILKDISANSFVEYEMSNFQIDTLKLAFSTQHTDTFKMSRCLPIYRDILVFRNKGEVVCIAKLCLECKRFYFIKKEDFDSGFFGQNGEWEILRKLLKHQKKPNSWKTREE
ncbi:MAG: hypothetical protein RLZZ337_549 [Bacteroidota bacterium]|jgi:hypothetical protein